MKNTRLIAAAVVLAGFGPATTVALASNGSDDAVRVSSAPAAGLLGTNSSDDSARTASSGRRGDDNGRHRHRNRDRSRGAHHRRGVDDHGGRRDRDNRVEVGDDRNNRVEVGDDRGRGDDGGHGRGRGRGRGGDD
jgi:hypothetical protein